MDTGASHEALGPLAESWLTARALRGSPRAQQARRDDLIRLAWAVRAWAHGAERVPLVSPLDAFGELTTLDLTPDAVVGALVYLGSFSRQATLMRTLSTLRVFCRWLVRKGYLSSNPCDDEDVEIPGVPDTPDDGRLVHAFNADEVNAMREAAASPSPITVSAWPARDIAIVDTLAGCGPRASELTHLEIRHIDWLAPDPLLRLVKGTKGSKPREVPLPSRAQASLRAYLDDRTDLLGVPDDDSIVFTRFDGSAIDRYFLDRMVRRLARDAGVTTPPDAATHAFRHHYGVSLAQLGVPVPVIQQLMGHADSRTTSIYMRMAGSQLAGALKTAGWL